MHTINYYPINVYFHLTGAIGWSIIGYRWNEKAIMLTFVPQIFIFTIGMFIL